MSIKRFIWYMFALLCCFGLIVTLASPVFARQPTEGDKLVDKGVTSAANTSSTVSSADDGSTLSLKSVSGESTLIKVYPFYGVNIIYLQCGHVVGRVLPAGCGHSAGSWRYTTDCSKSDPIYVTLPCMRHKP